MKIIYYRNFAYNLIKKGEQHMNKKVIKIVCITILFTLIFQVLIPMTMGIKVLAENDDAIIEIYTKEDFFNFIDDINMNYGTYEGKEIRLMNDIDLGTSVENPCKTIDIGWGRVFNGQNYTIYNLYLQKPLFRQNSGTIKNLNIENARNPIKRNGRKSI